MKRYFCSLFLLLAGLCAGISLYAESDSAAKDKVKESISEPTGEINGFGYVDLGLPSGLKWSTCNVGAKPPSQYGNHYAWGETWKKKYFGSNNYRKIVGNVTDISGKAEYDAAASEMGESWRMPTKDEWLELVVNCDWKFITYDNANGYKVTGPNGNSIFLPAAGYRYKNTFKDSGIYGIYWSSTPYDNTRVNAWRMYFDKDNYNVDWYHRIVGRSVRGVSN